MKKKLTFDEVMAKYEEIVNGEFTYPCFESYYVTDNDWDNKDEKPYKLKTCMLFPIAPHSKNENNKYILSEEQKTLFKNRLIETFNKENIYSLL